MRVLVTLFIVCFVCLSFMACKSEKQAAEKEKRSSVIEKSLNSSTETETMKESSKPVKKQVVSEKEEVSDLADKKDLSDNSSQSNLSVEDVEDTDK